MKHQINRRQFLATAGAGAAAALLSRLGLPAAAAAEALANNRKPNIIVILSDDVGLHQIGCYGGDARTPHIDELARTGMRFEYCYSTPLCGPSRFQLLTGCYPFRSGLNTNGRWPRTQINPQKQTMLPPVLEPAGYVTACVGKWGQMPLGPREWGFDEYVEVRPKYRYWAVDDDATYEVNGKSVRLAKDEYMPDQCHKFLVDFMTRHRDQPFFVYYPMAHMHGPLFRTPDSKPDVKGGQREAANIAYMDKLVGELATALDRLKLREKTLLIFTSDNGSFGRLGNRSMVGGKGKMTEGGSRVPLIANWPGTIPAGVVNHDLTDFSDFFPTVAQVAGAPVPPGVAVDGQSFAAQLKGEKGKPREWVYVELDGQSYVRDVRYKLTNDGKMFDLKDAPFEELPVPADSKDAQIVATRQRLQKILDQHPAAPGRGGTGEPSD